MTPPSLEEKKIQDHSSQFILSKLDFKDLLQSLTSASSCGSLSLAQLKRAFSDLQVPLDELTSPDSTTHKLLNRTRNDKKLFDLKKLSLISILLGKGKDKDKAEWLFRIYDIDASDVLEEPEFAAMVSEIVEVSARIIPAVAIGEGLQSFSKEELLLYTDRLESGRERVEKQMAEDFIAANAGSHEGFVKNMQGKGLGRLLYSCKVREMLRKAVEDT